MKKSLSVKFQQQKIKLARLAKVLKITRPTLYRYLSLYDQKQTTLIPKSALQVLQLFDQMADGKIVTLPPTLIHLQETLQPAPRVKASLIRSIQAFDETHHQHFLGDLLTTINSGKSRALLRLVKRLSTVVSKTLPASKIESEIDWFLDYLLHKYSKDEPNERYLR
jgi:hypothetical protein